jgi:tetratricopeptide (TPR) repeat protein
MTVNNEAPEDEKGYQNHALYHSAIQHLEEGDDAGAADKLTRLGKLYPADRGLRDLQVRTALRATLAQEGETKVRRRQPIPVLRTVLLALLVFSVCLAAISGFIAADHRIVVPTREAQERELRIQSLKNEGEQRFTNGDWIGARQTMQQLLDLVPGEPTAQAIIAQSYAEEELDRMYTDALTAEQQGTWQEALAAFRQIEAQRAGYRDVPQHIQALERLERLEAQWQAAQAALNSGDWKNGIILLTQIRAEDPSFRRQEVEDQLFQTCVQGAYQLLAEANGDLGTLNQAIHYLDQALALRPTDQTLITERQLASNYVAGMAAYAQSDWIQAVRQWGVVYAKRSDYQGGTLKPLLQETYPKAARELVAQANGAAQPLLEALRYFDQALLFQPGDEQLLKERGMVSDFLDGATAFNQENWNSAIAYWGPIYAAQPDYQNGVLAEKLRRACNNSPTPDTTYCPTQ